LKLSASSGIKLANAPKKVEASPAESKESTPAPAEESKPKLEQPKAELKAESKAESKADSTPAPAETKKEVESEVSELPSLIPTPKPTASSKPATPAPAVQTSDSNAKDQDDIVDEEVVNDLFGGKDHVSIMFMGHVDAGKSTMGGNILYLTGSVDKRTVEKYEREAKDAGRQGWYLSWIMDTNKEERNDGKTIEVGKAYFETEKRRYTILDAPGHKMYVSEMIGGASQADVGVLVISARKGEYETGFEKGGQTREHALLAKNQGVNKIVVVVNKMDDPTVGWSEERYKECIKKPEIFLKGIGYKPEDILFMPVSGFTGAGLKDRVDPKDCPWYTGPSLLEYLDNMQHLDRKINGPFMLPIAGKMKDMGTIVEGKIESGHIKKNQSLMLMPNKTNVEVITIYNESEQEADAAYCGEQVRLKLRGIEEEDLAPGYVLTSVKNPVKTVTRFAAQVAIVELKSILSNGFSCVMHLHTAIEEVKIVELKHKLEKGTNRKSKKPPAFAKKGMKVIAILETPELVCAETFNDYPQLGRFTLRDQGTTIAIGKITKLL
jgi:peptide chain release factor subunit 3